MKNQDVIQALEFMIAESLRGRKWRHAQRLVGLALLFRKRTHRERVEVGLGPIERVDVFQLPPKQFAAEFLFDKDEVRDIVSALNIGDTINAGTPGKQVCCDTKTALCVMLWRLHVAIGYRHGVKLFGISETKLGKITQHMLRIFYTRFSYLLTETLPRLSAGRIKEYQDAMEDYAIDQGFRSHIPSVAFFIDGSEVRIARPYDGGNQEDLNLQKTCYGGHKKFHGLCFQGLGSPDGLLVDVYGFKPSTWSDVRLLRQSKLQDRLGTIEKEIETEVRVLGDPAYISQTYIFSNRKKISGQEFPPHIQTANRWVKVLRISIENIFGDLKGRFPILCSRKLVLGNQPCTFIIGNCIILKNFLSCFRETNPTAQKFGVRPPGFEEYISRDTKLE